LTFVPEKPQEKVVELSDQEKLDELDQKILDAKAGMQSAASVGVQVVSQPENLMPRIELIISRTNPNL
jgi:hypothetical protein